MEWTRSNTLALANQKCTYCHGLGMRGDLSETPCDCVFRAIFRICHERFKQSANSDGYMRQVRLEIQNGPDRRGAWGHKEEEYMADFLVLAKRHLTEEEHRIFKYKFVLGADWRLCARRLGTDRGDIFNSVYRIMKKMGRVYAELQPYALFPLSEYFYGCHTDIPTKALRPTPARVIPIRPPVLQRRDQPSVTLSRIPKIA